MISLMNDADSAKKPIESITSIPNSRSRKYSDASNESEISLDQEMTEQIFKAFIFLSIVGLCSFPFL
jgi:hypothetical protein